MFHYPILPETPCFAHPDGPLRESEKPSVFHLLKGSINLPIPGDVNAVIADGMFIIQTSVKEKTTTFAAFARSALLKIFKPTKHWPDLRFDVHELPSIKDIKRKSWDENTEKHFTFGPHQRIPEDQIVNNNSL